MQNIMDKINIASKDGNVKYNARALILLAVPGISGRGKMIRPKVFEAGVAMGY